MKTAMTPETLPVSHDDDNDYDILFPSSKYVMMNHTFLRSLLLSNVVVKALCYNLPNPFGRTRPWVYSVSRNEYQKQNNNVPGE
jgi:hypothetical protein